MAITQKDIVAAYAQIYKYRPVDIVTFLCDRQYLGNDTDGGKIIYPGWWKYIKEVFRDDHRYLIVFTGAQGFGKTRIAAYCIAYILYRLSCMHNPWTFFRRGTDGLLSVSFFNLVEMKKGSRAFRYLQTALSSSPWFNQKGGAATGLSGILTLPLFEWLHSTPRKSGFGIQGEDVVTGILDEVDNPHASEGDKQRVLSAWKATLRRFEGRFIHEKTQSSISRLFVVSSKQDELGFIETFIEEQAGNPNVYIVDAKQWDIYSPDKYCGKKFHVLVGNDFDPSRVIREEERFDLIREGRQVEEIPIEYKKQFETDVVGSLRDFAGVAVKGTRKNKLFQNEKHIKFDRTKQNPVAIETIITDLDDSTKWIDYVDLSKLRVSKDIPRACHYDISFSHDSAAIALSCCAGWQTGEYENEDGTFSEIKVPIVETDMIIRVKAKKKGKIRLSKMRELIIALRRKGIRFSIVTADLRLLSEDTRQILQAAKIKTEYFSCDKTPQCAVDLRTLMSEDRWLCHPHRWFYFEAKHIEHDLSTNKVDHPKIVKERWIAEDGSQREKILEGSKDVFDAVCGSVYHILKMTKDAPTSRQMHSLLRKLQAPTHLSSVGTEWLSGMSKVDIEEKHLPEAKSQDVEKMRKVLSALRRR